MNSEQEIKNLKNKILSLSKSFKYDEKFIERGINRAEELHKEHKRRSGEPYIIHPLNVAVEIANLNIGQDAVVAALLHDTIEDCPITKEELEKEFNETVANLVEGVTKLDNIADDSLKRYTEILSLRKFIISSAEDARVLLIKLADRLHNMRTVDALKPERQIEYSDETLKVYVPLAEYIGIGKWKRELEDISFRKKEPEIYQLIKKRIEEDHRVHDKLVEQLIKKVKRILAGQDVKIDKVYGRTKSIYATYKKVAKYIEEGKISEDNTDWNISAIKDLVALSILVKDDIIDCYKILGLIHASFEYLPKELDDYIARPKKNGYRALQTTILHEGNTAEIQIKTAEMHEVNEFGAASHIAYKISGKRNANNSNQYSWVKDLTLWSGKSAGEEKYKLNAFSDKIFVITPKGKVIELAKGATPIDFAYMIHTEVGNRFIGAKINESIGKADTELHNGDLVEILTSKNPKKPSLEWVNYAHLNSTKQKIKRFFLENEKESNIQNGKKLITDHIYKKIKLDWLVLDSGIIKFICNELGCTDIDKFYWGINSGSISKKSVLHLLVRKLNLPRDKEEKTITNEAETGSSARVMVEGDSSLDYKTAGCCMPIKGDEIVGIVTLRDGLKIHRKVCPNVALLDEGRKLTAKWVSFK